MRMRLGVILCCLFAMSTATFAGETGHYVNGVEGIRAGTAPGPGLYLRSFNVYYHADDITDKNGKDLDLGFELDVVGTVNRLIWITDKKILGADFGMDIVVPLLHQDIEFDALGIDHDNTNIGDINVEPLLLSWHGERWDAAAGVSVYLPTGDYHKRNYASVGKDFWTVMGTLGGTVYLDKGKTWSVSVLSRYETHTEKDHSEIRPGDDFHFEWGIGKTIKKVWDVGAVGYCQWQVSDDTGSDVTWDRNVHDRVFGIGAEVSYFMPQHKLGFSLRHVQEFGAEDRPEGGITCFTLTKIF